MTRTVADAALLMRVISRPDAADWTSLPPEDLDWLDLDRAGVRAAGRAPPRRRLRRTGRARGRRGRTPGTRLCFEEAGAVVEEPLAPFARRRSCSTPRPVLAGAVVERLPALPVEAKRRVLPYIAEWVHGGADVSGARVLACYHSIMGSRRGPSPRPSRSTWSSPPSPRPRRSPPSSRCPTATQTGDAHIGFTAPYNMSGQPATRQRRLHRRRPPGGLQVAGRRFDDLGVLRAAAWWEAARPESARPDWPIRQRATRVRPTDAGTREAATAG